ncbi:MAG: choice-of-anchor A family protein [Deltaproteobacteria bacterium]|nr:choice-of-anchor A family protein [Deltaproteobacteria bacterium]
MRPLLLPAALTAALLASPALAATTPLDGGSGPYGSIVFDVDPFGAWSGAFNATDPDDPTQTLALGGTVADNSIVLSFPALGRAIALREGRSYEGVMGTILAADPDVYDATTDVVTGDSRTTTWRLSTDAEDPLSAVAITLTQVASGTTLTQTYTITNEGAEDLDILFTQATDADMVGGGANTGRYDVRWPGAAATWPSSVSILDSTGRIGMTIGMASDGVFDGYRTLGANAPGWESYRLLYLGLAGTYLGPDQLNGLFRFDPATGQNSGRGRDFSDEVDDDPDGDHVSNRVGDVVMDLQHSTTLVAGGTFTGTVTTTLFSGGPFFAADPCPPSVVALGAAVSSVFDAVPGFGATSYSGGGELGLPPGVVVTQGGVGGYAGEVGQFDFTVTASDEHGNGATVTCSLSVTPMCPPGTTADIGLVGAGASQLNALICGDYTGGKDVEGALAVMGDLTMEGFSVGLGIEAPGGDDHAQDAGEPVAVLSVGGTFTGTDGEIYGDGSYGADAVTSGVTMMEGGALAQGDLLNPGGRCTLVGDTARFLATAYESTSSVAELHWWDGNIVLTGTEPDENVFFIDASDPVFAPPSTAITIDVPAGSRVLVNVSGETVAFGNGEFWLADGVSPGDVLFNFYEATSIAIAQFPFRGSILAPFAAVAYSNGQIFGTLVAGSLDGDVELHLAPFSGTFAVDCPNR